MHFRTFRMALFIKEHFQFRKFSNALEDVQRDSKNKLQKLLKSRWKLKDQGD